MNKDDAIWITRDGGEMRIIIDKPVVDWSKMPAWANYVTIDQEGDLWWWRNRPCIELGRWAMNTMEPDGGNFGVIPRKYVPSWTGDWKDSLVERPKV